MTVDDLVKVYIEAFDAMKALEDWPNDSFLDGTCERAGIAAVIRAVRDEMDRQRGDDWRWGDTVYFFNKILGDAGNEKVAGVIGLDPVGAGLSPASGQAPATDPAPAVCEWGLIERKQGLTTWSSDHRWHVFFSYEKLPLLCNECGKPIKFTEAQR